METGEVALSDTEAPKPKRKYKPRAICTDPELKYRYKPKPGPKPNHRTRRKRREKAKTDPEKRRFARASARAKIIMANPVTRAKAAARLLPHVQRMKTHPSRLGIPDGMNRAEAEAAWATAREQAEKVYNKMVEQGIAASANPEDFERVSVKRDDGTEYVVLVPKTDEAKAATAIKEAMVMVLGPTVQATKLSAIRTVLEWTKAKPASKSEVSVTKAEDWLAAVTADALKDDESD